MPFARPHRTPRRLIHSAAILLVGLPLAVASALLGGCGTAASSSKSEPGAMASANLDRDAYSRLGYRLVWTGYASLSPGDKIIDFEVLGDTLAVQDSSSVVSALSPTSGQLKWAAPLASRLTRFVGMVRDADRLIVCSESDAFYLGADTGTLLAKQAFEKVVNTKPVLNGNILVFGTASGDVLGHLTSGFKAWAYAVGGSFDADPVAIGTDYVGLVSQNGRVMIIMPATASAASQYQIYSGVAANPAASDHSLYVASLDQSIYAFDLYATQPRWRKRTETPLRSSPTYHSGRLYVEIPGTGMLCLNADNGAEVWGAAGVKGTVIGTVKGNLLAWNGNEAVVLDAKTGDILERASLPGLKALVPDRFENGYLYAVTPGGAVHKFEAR